jgi:hypothetical protein
MNFETKKARAGKKQSSGLLRLPLGKKSKSVQKNECSSVASMERASWETPSQFASRQFVVQQDSARTETLSFVWSNKYFRNVKYPAETESMIASWPSPAQVRAAMAAAPAVLAASPIVSPPVKVVAQAALPVSASQPSQSLSVDPIIEWDDLVLPPENEDRVQYFEAQFTSLHVSDAAPPTHVTDRFQKSHVAYSAISAADAPVELSVAKSSAPLAIVDRSVPSLIALPVEMMPESDDAPSSTAAGAQISTQLKSIHRGLTDSAVARDSLTANTMEYDVTSFSYRIMTKLGWLPGQPLGRCVGLGLTNGAVLPSQLAFLYDSPYGQRGYNEHAGLGSFADWFDKPAVNRVSIHQQLADFLFNSKQSQCMFTNALSKVERALVHDLADEYGLAHKSYGKGEERYLVVSKRPRQIKQLHSSGDQEDDEERERQAAIKALQDEYARSKRRRGPISALSAVPPPPCVLRDTLRVQGTNLSAEPVRVPEQSNCNAPRPMPTGPPRSQQFANQATMHHQQSHSRNEARPHRGGRGGRGGRNHTAAASPASISNST